MNLSLANSTDANFTGADLYEAKLENVTVASAPSKSSSLDATTSKGLTGTLRSLPPNRVMVDGALAGQGDRQSDPRTALVVDDSRYYGSGSKVAILGDSLSVAPTRRCRNAWWVTRPGSSPCSAKGSPAAPWSELAPMHPPVAQHRAQQFGASGAKVAVVELGTNDAWWPALIARDAIAAMDGVYASLADACTVGVLVTETDPDDAYDPVEAASINDHTRAPADVVVDWRLHADPSAIAADGIHLTEAGTLAFADAIVEGVDLCLAQP